MLANSIFDKLDRVGLHLISWAHEVKKNKAWIKHKLKERLDKLQQGDWDDNSLAEIIDSRIHLNLEIDNDKNYWEQRARVN